MKTPTNDVSNELPPGTMASPPQPPPPTPLPPLASMRLRHNIVMKFVEVFVVLSFLVSSVQSFSFHHHDVARRGQTGRQYAYFKASIALYLNSNDDSNSKEYFIRRAVFADMGPSSRILADGFFGDRDFFTYNIEKLRTYLSLESDFPKERDEHEMLVACQRSNGKVVAVCDVDNRPALKTQRPYMCNLAVDKQWRGKGLAKALVKECEAIVQSEWGKNELHLKARQRNGAAIELYKSLGYDVLDELYDVSYMDHLVVMKKNVSSAKENASPASTNATVPATELVSDQV